MQKSCSFPLLFRVCQTFRDKAKFVKNLISTESLLNEQPVRTPNGLRMFTQSVKFWKVRLRETIIIKEIVSFLPPNSKPWPTISLKKEDIMKNKWFYKLHAAIFWAMHKSFMNSGRPTHRLWFFLQKTNKFFFAKTFKYFKIWRTSCAERASEEWGPQTLT